MSMRARRILWSLVGIVLAAGTFLAGYFSADCPVDYVPPWEFDRYCLFTSNRSDGELCFALMREFERRKFIHRWFPQRALKCGVAELKHALASLPKGTNVLWTDLPDKFDYPRPDAIADIISSAGQHDVHVEKSPMVK
jgi:hypothetical protein